MRPSRLMLLLEFVGTNSGGCPRHLGELKAYKGYDRIAGPSWRSVARKARPLALLFPGR